MNNNKQTAVEWLATYLKGITSLNCDEVIEQAKARKKEQMVEFAINCQEMFKHQIEQYYNETYGGEQ